MNLNTTNYLKAQKVIRVGRSNGLKLCADSKVYFHMKKHRWSLRWESNSPYTDTYNIAVEPENSSAGQDEDALLNAFEIRFRLYHDAKVAEVLSSNNNKMLRTWYQYPNMLNYLPDEKYQRNVFLDEWLSFCLQFGRCHNKNTTCLAFFE